MNFLFKNNGQYYVKQKIQRTLKNTCKILLTLSLYYATSTKFIPASFAIITTDNIESMYKPEKDGNVTVTISPENENLDVVIKQGPCSIAMNALMLKDVDTLKTGDDIIKLGLKAAMGGLMVDADPLYNKEEVFNWTQDKVFKGQFSNSNDVLIDPIQNMFVRNKLRDKLFSSDLSWSSDIGIGKGDIDGTNTSTKTITEKKLLVT